MTWPETRRPDAQAKQSNSRPVAECGLFATLSAPAQLAEIWRLSGSIPRDFGQSGPESLPADNAFRRGAKHRHPDFRPIISAFGAGCPKEMFCSIEGLSVHASDCYIAFNFVLFIPEGSPARPVSPTQSKSDPSCSLGTAVIRANAAASDSERRAQVRCGTFVAACRTRSRACE